MVSLCAGGELHPNSWRVCKQAGKAELFREDTSDVRADAALQILSCQLSKICNMSGIPATEQFWCEGLLGCPLHCKSQLAAFYNGSPDVTFGRELQMATMWEGYCAFDAIYTVINSVFKKKSLIPSVIHRPLMSHPWRGPGRLPTREASIVETKVWPDQWWKVKARGGSSA